MSQITGITSLDELIIFDDVIRKTCKRTINPVYFDDIVNEMYIKIKRYLDNGKIINGGYIYLSMKTINLNMIENDNKHKHNEITEAIERICDDYSESYYEEIDNRINEITNFLSGFLTKDQIYLYQFYKLNGLKPTAIFFKKSDSSIKYRIKKIFRLIRENGSLEQFKIRKD